MAYKVILEKAVRGFASAVELVLIDFSFGKSRFRKHGSRMRPIIHTTIINDYRHQAAPRVVYVRERK